MLIALKLYGNTPRPVAQQRLAARHRLTWSCINIFPAVFLKVPVISWSYF